MHFYVIAGLALASEIPFPGLIEETQEPADGAAVEIRLAPVPDALTDASRAGPNWAMSERQLLLAIPGIARFLLTEGRDVAVEPAPGRLPGETATFITETVFGILMHQRGRVVLRASAAVVGGRAVLFSGPSGAGKSALAAALDQAGHAFLSDDLCVLELGASDAVLVPPDNRHLKLWAETLDALALNRGDADRVREGIEKYRVRPRRDPAAGPVPVAAIYELRESPQSRAWAVEAVRGVDIVRTLVDAAYRPPLVAGMGHRAPYFRAAGALARSGGIYALTRRLDFARMMEGIDALESHWAASGLIGAVR